jgi:hypothetical protein
MAFTSILFPDTRPDFPFGLAAICKRGYGLLYIFGSAEATKNGLTTNQT